MCFHCFWTTETCSLRRCGSQRQASARGRGRPRQDQVWSKVLSLPRGGHTPCLPAASLSAADADSPSQSSSASATLPSQLALPRVPTAEPPRRLPLPGHRASPRARSISEAPGRGRPGDPRTPEPQARQRAALTGSRPKETVSSLSLRHLGRTSLRCSASLFLLRRSVTSGPALGLQRSLRAGELALRALTSQHTRVSGTHLSVHSHPAPAAHLVSP